MLNLWMGDYLRAQHRIPNSIFTFEIHSLATLTFSPSQRLLNIKKAFVQDSVYKTRVLLQHFDFSYIHRMKSFQMQFLNLDDRNPPVFVKSVSTSQPDQCSQSGDPHG